MAKQNKKSLTNLMEVIVNVCLMTICIGVTVLFLTLVYHTDCKGLFSMIFNIPLLSAAAVITLTLWGIFTPFLVRVTENVYKIIIPGMMPAAFYLIGNCLFHLIKEAF